MSPDIGERRNGARVDPPVIVERDRKESVEPPPIRPGMNPSKFPPYGMIIGLVTVMPPMASFDVAP
jgi:hypothetical protein